MREWFTVDAARRRARSGVRAVSAGVTAVPSGNEAGDSEDDAVGAEAATATCAPMPAPSAPLEQAIMYAVCGWLALCVERVAVAVDIQPVAIEGI